MPPKAKGAVGSREYEKKKAQNKRSGPSRVAVVGDGDMDADWRAAQLAAKEKAERNDGSDASDGDDDDDDDDDSDNDVDDKKVAAPVKAAAPAKKAAANAKAAPAAPATATATATADDDDDDDEDDDAAVIANPNRQTKKTAIKAKDIDSIAAPQLSRKEVRAAAADGVETLVTEPLHTARSGRESKGARGLLESDSRR